MNDEESFQREIRSIASERARLNQKLMGLQHESKAMQKLVISSIAKCQTFGRDEYQPHLDELARVKAAISSTGIVQMALVRINKSYTRKMQGLVKTVNDERRKMEASVEKYEREIGGLATSLRALAMFHDPGNLNHLEKSNVPDLLEESEGIAEDDNKDLNVAL